MSHNGLTSLGTRGDPGMTTSVNADLSKPPADPASTLYVVWGGHNDIWSTARIRRRRIFLSMGAVLHGEGATHILVPGVMDLGLATSQPFHPTTQADAILARAFVGVIIAIPEPSAACLSLEKLLRPTQ